MALAVLKASNYIVVKQIDKKIQDAIVLCTGDKLSPFHLFQSISMVIQRVNVVCAMGYPKEQSTG